MTRRLFALFLSLAVGLSALAAAGTAVAKSKKEIDAETDEALARLYAQSSAAKTLGEQAVGILVFPEITKGGFIIGGEHGDGALRVGGKTDGYYESSSASIGLQVGISSRSLVIMFMTQEALAKFKASDKWEAGVDADVTVVESGATGSIDTTTGKNQVIGFNFGEKGLMAGVSIEGTKVEEKD